MFSTAVSDENEVRLGSREQPFCINDFQWDAEQRTLLIKSKTIRLTPTQYRLLAPLLYGRPVSYVELARLTYNCAFDENVRKTMDKQIDRIRTKMYGTDFYIYCILKYGYMLIGDDLS